MAGIDIGCDFSDEHTDTILDLVRLNDDSSHKIVGVYGTPKGSANPFGSTRPRGRETEVKETTFVYNMQRFRDAGIEVNLTVNMLLPYLRGYGPEISIFDNLQIQNRMKCMWGQYDNYVNNWIMATPFLIDLFHEDEYNAGVMISTIMNVHGLRQVQEIRDRWSKVRRICPSLWMNRDFSWLIKANKIIPLELLANEFCSIGGAECDGLYRQACYLSQNLDTQWNPMKSACIESRKNNQEAWLMARFILPQWVKMYEVETGVKRFKVTGRTHNAEYVKYIGGVYMAGAASGNLLQLWGQLEATLDKEHWKEQQDKAVDQTMLRMEDIEKLLPNFMNCNPNYCGVKCQFCRNALYDIVQCKEREKDAD